MNKDVIYIEPEDDITDIITKIENSKEKITAIVPPKKAAVLRSIVNIKLIAKAGANNGKTVVLVTTDPSIIKLAATAKLLVTKNLQSAPSVPELGESVSAEKVETEEITDPEAESTKELEEEEPEEEAAEEKEEAEEEGEAVESNEENALEEKAEETDEAQDKKAKKTKKKGTSSNKFIAWIQTHKILVICGGVGLVLLILLLVWALVIAPAATVTVGIRTVTSNFSENVTFTEKLEEEKVSEGKFYLKSEKLETNNEVAFTATGQKNIGEKATGEVTAYKDFPITGQGGSVAINAGSTTFKADDLVYVATEDHTIMWDGDMKTITNDCLNAYESTIKSYCRVTVKVPVVAEAPGEKYNIPAYTDSRWHTSVDAEAFSEKPMTGGTDKMITVVQQSDIDTALAEMKTASEASNKEKLVSKISDDSFIIESSFKETVGEAVATPAVGEEVKEGDKPKVAVTTTDTIYVIDETKVKEFIAEKAKLAENYKIYEINSPFIENFMQSENGFVGKLKTSYVSGPKVTENDVLEIIKGKGLGDARHDLMQIDGVNSVTTNVSYPWVMSIPNDSNKVTVNINVEEK